MKEKYDLSNKSLQMKRVTHVHKPGYKFPVEKRIEVITKCLALGNMRLVSELTGVSYTLIRIWKGQPWWKEMEAEIKASRKAQVDNKLSRLVDKALETMEDRLDNGDFVYDQKRGEVSRKPVSLKEARGAANDLLQRQAALVKQEHEEKTMNTNTSMKDMLSDLANQFAAFNTKRTVEVVATDVTPKVETVSGDLPTQDTETEEYDDKFEDEELYGLSDDVPTEDGDQ